MVGLKEDDINVANQSSTRDFDDVEHGRTERENEMHSVTGLEIHGQVDLDGVRQSSLEDSGKRGWTTILHIWRIPFQRIQSW